MDEAVAMIVYSALLALGMLLTAPWWLWRMARSGRYRAGLGQRLGRVPAQIRASIAGRHVIWIHAVSVGEVLAAERLVRELTARLGPDPDPGWCVAISTTTATGQRLARERFPSHPVFFCPLDFAFSVRPWMQALEPRLLVLVESELWPRMLHVCAHANVPVSVVNARVSDRSFHRTRRVRALWMRMARHVTLFLAQGEETRTRLLELGVTPERVARVGNLKYDAPPLAPDALVGAVRRSLGEETQLVVCGSTLNGEENAILNAWPEVQRLRPRARLLLAPRHPERFDTVANLVAERGLAVIRLSRFAPENPAGATRALPGDGVLLLDSLGSLAAMYQLAAVAFVGGSLVNRGGHNPLEPTRFGVPVLVGESVANFREVVRAMLAAKAIRMVSRARWAEAVTAMLFDGRAMGERGRQFFEAQSGATERTADALLGLLGRWSAPTPPPEDQR